MVLLRLSLSLSLACPSFFSLPTDVQAEAVPLILGGGDVLMAAETGSGKTGVSTGTPRPRT